MAHKQKTRTIKGLKAEIETIHKNGFKIGRQGRCIQAITNCLRAEAKLKTLEEVKEWINEDIKIQREFLKEQPQNKKAIEWRIIGMRLLKGEIEG